MSYPGGYDPSTHHAHGGQMPPPQQQWPGGYQASPQQPYSQHGYPPPQPQYWAPQQPIPQQFTGSTTKTRPPFPHGQHIRWSFLSVGIWLIIGYPWAYLWHRYGPTKAVSHTRFH